MISQSDPEYLSKEAYQGFEKELEYLIKEKRKEIAERLEESKSADDLLENSEYQEIKGEQIINETRIAGLEDILSRAEIISKPRKSYLKIDLGCSVVLKKAMSKEIFKYQIVGSEETDPSKNKISNECPLGMSLLGRKKGEIVEVLTPKGKIKYTIVKLI